MNNCCIGTYNGLLDIIPCIGVDITFILFGTSLGGIAYYTVSIFYIDIIIGSECLILIIVLLQKSKLILWFSLKLIFSLSSYFY